MYFLLCCLLQFGLCWGTTPPVSQCSNRKHCEPPEALMRAVGSQPHTEEVCDVSDLQTAQMNTAAENNNMELPSAVTH